jgi:mannose-6-phosphate isomerase
MKMQPVLKEKVWGGRRLAQVLGKRLPPDEPIGESWELADHPRGTSIVAEGSLAGRSLREVLERHGEAVLGRALVAKGWAKRFGLLIKFIDASDRLSVQVHPDDAYAARHAPGESGKTECWVVVHAEPDAWIVRGLAPATTREQCAEAIKAGELEPLLKKRQVKAGDFVWIPAGTVHAIGPGIVLAEVQQNSDVTYRVYDWGRVGLDGKPRVLHVADALRATNFTAAEPPSGGRGRTADETGLAIEHLADCPAFSLSRVRLDRRPWAAGTGGTFAALVVLAGRARLSSGAGGLDIARGDTVLVPADAGEYAFDAAERLEVLVAAPPGKAPAE